MAGTRDIYGSLTIDKLPTKSFPCSHFRRHQQNYVSSPHSLPYSRKSTLVQARKVVAAPMAAALIKAETPVQLKVKALVTVKHDTVENVKDMMFRWLASGGHTAQRGVILQLVSTEVDPIVGTTVRRRFGSPQLQGKAHR
ncbi:hypothetical protein QQP08_019938 [Theobroma cacao]|nr:hypothetical protein QQP08_019938 [Theobroma cacao]